MFRFIARYLAIASLAIAFSVIFLSLISYNYQDESILYSSSESTMPQNILGKFGAQLAAFLFFLFGFTAYAILPLIIVNILFLLNYIAYQDNRIRYLSAIIFLILFTGLSNIYSIEFLKIFIQEEFLG